MLLIPGAITLGASALHAQPAPTVRQGLLTFESGVLWASVSRAWVGQRALWVAAVNTSNTPAEFAAQLLRLEATMGWSTVNPSWRTRRGPWVAEVHAADSFGAVARLLLELEAITLWSAMQPTWRGARRDAWIASLRAVL